MLFKAFLVLRKQSLVPWGGALGGVDGGPAQEGGAPGGVGNDTAQEGDATDIIGCLGLRVWGPVEEL